MTQCCNHATFREVVVQVVILIIMIVGTSFIEWKDTRELQQRIGTLEVQVQRLEQHLKVKDRRE